MVLLFMFQKYCSGGKLRAPILMTVSTFKQRQDSLSECFLSAAISFFFLSNYLSMFSYCFQPLLSQFLSVVILYAKCKYESMPFLPESNTACWD